MGLGLSGYHCIIGSICKRTWDGIMKDRKRWELRTGMGVRCVTLRGWHWRLRSEALGKHGNDTPFAIKLVVLLYIDVLVSRVQVLRAHYVLPIR